jgi:hypothetical protein
VLFGSKLFEDDATEAEAGLGGVTAPPLLACDTGIALLQRWRLSPLPLPSHA